MTSMPRPPKDKAPDKAPSGRPPAAARRTGPKTLASPREQELADFFENASIGLHWVGPDGTILWANRSELEYLGYTAAEYIGRNITEFHADPPVIADILERLTRNETLHNYEARLRCKDGSIRHVLIDSNVYREDGKFVHTRCFTRDFHSLRLTRDSLRASQAQLRLIADNATTLLAQCDRDDRYLFVNRLYAQRFGMQPQDLIGRRIPDVVGGPAFAALQPHIARALAGETVDFDAELEYSGLGKRFVHCSYVPVVEAGVVTSYVAAITDITERWRHEQAMRQSDQRARVAARAGRLGFWSLDPATGARYWSQEIYEMAGMAAEAPTRELLLEHLHPDDRARVRAIQDEVMAGTADTIEVEYRLVRPDGGICWLLARGSLQESEGQRVMIGTAQDITERKLAEEALRESEERLALALSSANLGTYDLDIFTGRVLVNARLREIYAFAPAEEVTRERLMERWHPDERSSTHAQLEALLAAPRPFQVHRRIQRPDGSVRSLLISGLPVFHEGRLRRIVSVAEDVTERQQAEQLLRAREQQFREIADTIEEVFWVSDAVSHDPLYVSPGYETIWGRNVSELLAHRIHWAEGIHPDDRALVEREYYANIAQGDYNVRFRVVRPDGGIRWVHDRGYPVRDEAGAVVRYVGVAQDVTSQVEAERERAQLAAIVQSSQDAIISKDLNGIITSWNQAAQALYGYTADEVIGKPVLLLIPKELEPEETMILDCIRNGRPVANMETVRLNKYGERIDVSLTVSPIRNSQGQVIGASKIARDIREQRRARHALLQSEKLASVGRLSMTIAHEINNPLESVTNLLYLLRQETALSATGQQWLELAERELARASHITKQTLGFYRETASQVEIDLAAVAGELVRLYAGRAENKGVEVRLEAPRPLPRLVAVAGEIRQILSNLLSNSLDAVEPGGKIRLRLTPVSAAGRSGTRITIADNGNGIPPAAGKMIFEAFFTTKKDVGTGLGLWVTKQLTEKHRGKIRMRSRVGAGTVFSIFLPATEGGAAGLRPAEPVSRLRKPA